MNNLIAALIHASDGSFHQTAGMLIGYFNNPEAARRCAYKISVSSGKTAEVIGSQLSIFL